MYPLLNFKHHKKNQTSMVLSPRGDAFWGGKGRLPSAKPTSLFRGETETSKAKASRRKAMRWMVEVMLVFGLSEGHTLPKK